MATDGKKTRAVMTRYEVTKVIAARVQQLSEGSKSTLPEDHPCSSKGCGLMKIAVAELENGTIPMMIRRDLPDGTTETWRLADLRLPRAFMRHASAIDIL